MIPRGFRPNWTSAPGDTIADILRTKQLSKFDFSEIAGFSVDQIDDLVNGRATITLSTARILSATLGASTEFWMSRDYQYRQETARLNNIDREWLRELPLRDMLKFGWITPIPLPSEELSVCLQFFGVNSVSEWQSIYSQLEETVAFRSSQTFDSRLGATAAWLRQGELMASEIACGSWQPESFYNSLAEIRALTRQKSPQQFLPKLQSICSANGVACVVVRSPRGCTASGATRFLAEDKALMQFSFRYLTDDHFWFTFFHEAGHLVLQGEKMKFARVLQDNLPWILEDLEGSDSEDERQANEFAGSILIPEQFRTDLMRISVNARGIIRLAGKAGVSPGVVVGQLQHLGRIPYEHMNGLKRRFTWES